MKRVATSCARGEFCERRDLIAKMIPSFFPKRKKQPLCDLRSHEARVSPAEAYGSHPSRARVRLGGGAISNRVVLPTFAHAHAAFSRKANVRTRARVRAQL